MVTSRRWKKASDWSYTFAGIFIIQFLFAALWPAYLKLTAGQFHLIGQAEFAMELRGYRGSGTYHFAWTTPQKLVGQGFDVVRSSCTNYFDAFTLYLLAADLSKPVDVYRTDSNQWVVSACYDFEIRTMVVSALFALGFYILGRRFIARISPEDLARLKEEERPPQIG